MRYRKLKPVYFNTLLEADILDWVNQFNNFSEYCKGLFRRDMRFAETGLDPHLVAHIESLLETRLAERTILAREEGRKLDTSGMENLMDGFM